MKPPPSPILGNTGQTTARFAWTWRHGRLTRRGVPVRVPVRGARHLDVGVAAAAGRDHASDPPAPSPCPSGYPDAPGGSSQAAGGRVRGHGWAQQQAAVVATGRFRPDQGFAGAAQAAADQHAHRAGLGQAAHPTAVAGRAQRGLAGRRGVDVDDLMGGMQGHACLQGESARDKAGRVQRTRTFETILPHEHVHRPFRPE